MQVCYIFDIKSIDPIGQINFNDIIDKIKLNGATCKLTLFTSGTTGMPKKISHNFDSLSRLRLTFTISLGLLVFKYPFKSENFEIYINNKIKICLIGTI